MNLTDDDKAWLIASFATKADLERLPIHADIEGLADKIREDIERVEIKLLAFATKADLERLETNLLAFATKADLERLETNLPALATKADLERLETNLPAVATKADLERVETNLLAFATKADLERMETNLLTAFQQWANPLEQRMRTHREAMRALDLQIEYVDNRVKRLEHPGQNHPDDQAA